MNMKEELLFVGGICITHRPIKVKKKDSWKRELSFIGSTGKTCQVHWISTDEIAEVDSNRIWPLDTEESTIGLIGGELVKRYMMGDDYPEQVSCSIYNVNDLFVRFDYFIDEHYVQGDEFGLNQDTQEVKVIGYEGVDVSSLMKLQALCKLVDPNYKLGFYCKSSEEALEIFNNHYKFG